MNRIGYVINVVTVPAYRRTAILHCLEERGIQQVAQQASEMGRSPHKALGFVAGNEMDPRISQPTKERQPSLKLGGLNQPPIVATQVDDPVNRTPSSRRIGPIAGNEADVIEAHLVVGSGRA